MWIKRSEFEALEARITDLEGRLRTLQYERDLDRVYVPKGEYSNALAQIFGPMPSFHEISPSTAIQQIARHLGVKFKYHEAESESVSVEPINAKQEQA